MLLEHQNHVHYKLPKYHLLILLFAYYLDDMLQKYFFHYLNVFRKDDFIDIELTDFGGGIPDTTKDNLFEIFTTSKEYGTGLGLPIARQIIEDHSGRLLFESRPGDGCTFSILLPVNPGS